MELNGAVVVLTGANGGIGRAVLDALLDAGVAKVYAATRQANAALGGGDQRVIGLTLDVTDQTAIDAAAFACADATLLINNAGVNSNTLLFGDTDPAEARREVEVNYLGTLAVTRAFAPVLAANGGGMIVNVLSILSRINHPAMASYCASKAALYSATQAMRAQLAKQGTKVVAFMPGAVDTRLTAHLDVPKLSTEDTAAALIEAIRDDAEDAYPGEMASGVAAGLAADHKSVEAMFAGFL